MAKFNLLINVDDKILDDANLSVEELINDIGGILNEYCSENELFMRINAEILDETNVADNSNNDNYNNDNVWIEGYRVPKIPS